MLADFVNVRGGGLLLLGGRRSFAEGGYAGTPLADVMPVVVAGDAVPDSLTFFADLKVALTPAGDEPRGRADRRDAGARRRERWKTLPPVTTVNRIREVKPGAVTLVTGSVAQGGRAGMPGAPVRELRRSRCSFTSGTAAGCRSRSRSRTRGSGRWIRIRPADDRRPIRRFWRQMLRWLTTDVAGARRASSLPTDRRTRGRRSRFARTVVDSIFIARNDAKVVAHLTSDSGVLARPAARLGDRPRRRVPRHVHAGPGRASTRSASTRRCPNGVSAGDTTLRARRRSQHRVLRRRDARAAAQAHRDRDRRSLLHARDGVDAGRRRRDEQARRDGRESDGSVGHAGRSCCCSWCS